MIDEDRWERRLRDRRPFFEVASFALTTLTWVSLCAVSSYMVIRGYWTLAPPLKEMGWQGIFLYSLFAIPFVSIGLFSSLILTLVFWSLLLELKWDLEFGDNRALGIVVSVLSGLWHHAFGTFLLIMAVLLSIQILVALGQIGVATQ